MLLLGAAVQAATPLENAGIIPANIWFSRSPFFAGETVRIYTVIFNASGQDLNGIITFYSNDNPIGDVAFGVAEGRTQDIWLDWEAVWGQQEIQAKITAASSSRPGEAPVAVSLENAATGLRQQFIDLDTDHDRIGNATDTDDDNDGLADEKEFLAGTDPLSIDSDDDDIIDGEDQNPLVKNIPAASKTDNQPLNALAEKLPSAVAKTTQTIFEKTNAFRESQIPKLNARITQLTQEIDKFRDQEKLNQKSATGTTASSAIEFEKSSAKLWRWIRIGFTKALRAIFSSAVLFHLFLAVIAAIILKIFWQLWKRARRK